MSSNALQLCEYTVEALKFLLHIQHQCAPHVHEMWLQPPFFSVALPHCGQSFVFDLSQLYVSESSCIFCFHALAMGHVAGRWKGSLQAKLRSSELTIASGYSRTKSLCHSCT